MGNTTASNARPTAGSGRRRLAALAAAVIAVVGACATDADDSATDDSATEEASAPMSTGAPAPEPQMVDADDTDAAETSSQDSEDDATVGGVGDDTAALDLGRIGRDVIVEMDVTVASDDIERSVATLTTTARRLGGGVASSEVDFDGTGAHDGDEDEERGSAVLVLLVPPDSVDELLTGLDDVGDVQTINQRAQDVTEQLVDLDVRIDNARQSVVNVREFMDRADDLDDLVALERELTRRQTDLERLEAQRRNLEDRVALSTVTVRIVPESQVPGSDEIDLDIADGLANGWKSFVLVVTGLVFALATLLPFLVVGFIVLAGWWALRRRRSRHAAPEATNDPFDDGPASPPQ